MSENIEDGGPAFPSRFKDEDGMSLRDWFAGQVLASIAADVFMGRADEKAPKSWHGKPRCDLLASDCYVQADAMIAARKVKP